MFKNKLFLYGFGTGLIAATLLLQLMSYSEADSAAPNVQEQEIDWNAMFHDQLDRIKEAAEKNGYRVIQAQEERVTSALDHGLETQTLAITISNGMGTSEVAQQLYDLSLIDDIDEFIHAITSKLLDSKIQIGTYQFEGTPDIDYIIESITNS